ncbi:MAG: tyrosine--tRNA ligase [Clostridiales bacterium]|nr:tyrosine--tRNA ligase [Christensenellales bacterium]PWM04389.1 MAG: tyrosine--tRNA ligase [Clostridiales bacterium]
MQNVYDTLAERGFLKQCSHPEELRELLGREKVTFYIGFDPTADSLHIGHYVALMTMAHMQRAGHRPIVLLGGGTAMIGDPSGKSDMRRMMTNEEIDHNASCFQKQMARLIDFSEGKAIVANNANWLRSLNYLSFMRDIGVHFSVNRMLTFECYKQRMERGLTFFELGYMLMQSYDFLVLNREYGCILQMGGDDQWSNMLGGVDLIRRKEQKPAYCLTTALLTTSEGKKMGKTEKGALWLDKEKCSPYDFYQYWRNVDDADVEKCLSLLTFLPMEEIRAMCAQGGAALNQAKVALAYTLTAQVHGAEEADKAKQAAEALFGGGGDLSHMPTLALSQQQIDETGLRVTDLLVLGNLCKSKSDARRMIESGAVFAGDEKVTDVYAVLAEDKLAEGIVLKKGKKGFVRVCKG